MDGRRDVGADGGRDGGKDGISDGDGEASMESATFVLLLMMESKSSSGNVGTVSSIGREGGSNRWEASNSSIAAVPFDACIFCIRSIKSSTSMMGGVPEREVE